MFRKKLFATTLALAMSLSLSACNYTDLLSSAKSIPEIINHVLDPGRPELESTEDIVVIMQRGMHNMPDFDNSAFKADLEEACKSGSVSFIICDGNPEQNTSTFNYDKLDSSLPAKTLNNDLASRLENLETFSYTLKAKSEECNLVKSLLLAKQLLNNSKCHAPNKKIIICSNLINTMVPLKFTTQMLDNVQLSSIDSLNNQKNIPDLSGITVDIYYAGKVYDSEYELSQRECDNLIAFWSYYMDTAHAQYTFFSDSPVAPSNYFLDRAELPNVTDVPPTMDEDAFEAGAPIYISENDIKFVGDEDTFVDEKKAIKVLKKYLPKINNYSGSILLLGTTAKPKDATEEGCRDLSLRRARRIKETLIELGINDPSKLICAGGGYSTIYYKNDRKANGDFVEEIGKKNRSIILLSDNNDGYDELLSEFGE